MRIGTWNLAGRWSPAHRRLLEDQECDVWLLTEVHAGVSVPGMDVHRTSDVMSPGRSWAAVLSADDVEPEPDPHFASAMARVGGRRFVSSILPWRTCGPRWAGQDHAGRMRATLDALGGHLDAHTVWGGDWNQALEGTERAGSLDGRRQVLALTDATRLSVPTRSLGHANEGHRSIDHVAVPIGLDVDGAFRVPADAGGLRLSDHAAYVVSISGADVR